MKYILLLIALLCISQAQAQDEYPVSRIPDELLKNANAVIRYESTNFIQKDINNGTEEVTKVITILDEKGKDKAHLYLSQDKFRELKGFSGEIILASGKTFKKIGKGDLITTAISDNLATDDYWIYYKCTAPSYPFTVKYTYEVRWKDGIAWYPAFVPVSSDETAIERVEHRIEFPAGRSVRYKANEKAPDPQKSANGKDSVYAWKLENRSAVQWEPLAPSPEEIFPIVYISPGDFCFDGVCGKMSSWQEMGMFLSQLLDKRDILPQTAIDKVKEIISGTNDETEKIRLIYEYLQSTTRYVSIQLGIGGFQPIPAAQVVKTGYGDCKALTNYMKAMLQVAGIPSVYAVINTEKSRMFSDFSSLTQANHVVLMVPMKNDSIWIECTSRQLPLNYLHNSISGHDVLLVDKEKSRISTVRNLPENLNILSNYVHMKINPDASMHSDVRSICKNHCMEQFLYFTLDTQDEERSNRLAQNLGIQRPQISRIKTGYTKSSQPEVDINYQVDAERYANITGSRMFVRINPFKTNIGSIFSSSTRTLDIDMDSPIYRSDTICVEIPEKFHVESKPNSLKEETPFGTFSLAVEEKDNMLTFIHNINIPVGKYPASSYSKMKEFFKKIDVSFSKQLILKKEE